MISFLNLKRLYEKHKNEFLEVITHQLERSYFIGGEAVTKFSEEFSAWIGFGMKTSTCANGTDALMIAIKSLNLDREAEVIVPAMTFVATAEAVVNAGYNLKLVDITPDTWLMDPEKLEMLITDKVKLIIPVHLYGQMAEMDKIRAIAKKCSCFIIEDAAQAHGALYDGRPPGYFSDIATYSFFPGKNLGAFGDGGAITSLNENLIEKCMLLSNHGGKLKYQHDIVGFNSRLDAIQAAVLRIKLKYINSWNERRREIAKFYLESLKDIEEITLPSINYKALHVYHLFVVLVKDRNAFQYFLKEKGIETHIHYPKAICEQKAFKGFSFNMADYLNAIRLSRECVSLPICPFMTDSEVEFVCQTIKKFFGK